MKYSLGFMNWCSHDPAASIVQYDQFKGTINYITAEEGFFSRRKKSYHFPLRSIKYCLDWFGITMADIDVISLDYMDHERVFRTSDNYRLLVGDFIKSKLKIHERTKVIFCDTHHLAHAYAAFLPSGFKQSTVVIIDRLGSKQQTHSVYSANGNDGFQTMFEQKGTGIGLVYSLVTNLLGWDYGEEGKTMGLAPYGKDYDQIDSKLPKFKGHRSGLIVDYSHLVTRSPSPEFRCDFTSLGAVDDIYSRECTRIAYLLQQETEESIMHIVKESIKLTGIPRVCLAGGVALNCVANEIVAQMPEIETLFVPPAAGDSGVPFGLALHGMNNLNDEFIQTYLDTVGSKKYFPFSNDKNSSKCGLTEVKALLKKYHIEPVEYSPELIAEYLADSKVVCLCTEGIEHGPRALGHRSILADARNPKMKEIMNEKIKHREGYRPFAPIVLAEHFSEYFISPSGCHEYMLRAVECNEYACKTIPSVVHIDNSARVQTVEKRVGKVWEILEKFKQLTGVPVLINTSFNDNNEPIVFDAIDAFCCFLRTQADTLIVEDEVYLRTEFNNADLLLSDMKALQAERIRNNMADSLNELTGIGRLDFPELKRFLRMNLELSKYHKKYKTLDRLQSYLTSRDRTRPLLLDEYHEAMIKELTGIIGISFASIADDVYVLEDSVTSIENIRDCSDVILYNLSAIACNPFTKNLFADKHNLWWFYDISDIPAEVISSCEESSSIVGDIEMILNSYETDLERTIDDQFAELDV